ncbi:MAG: efflux RND transporter periplasmic adaptor subunit [Pirellulales bacterium]|nr:efflux RND transporter periplasmic adaptor subunit [Pirellulales bacterium]
MFGLRAYTAVAALLSALVAIGNIQAHEGHAPLPTKGVQVDVEKGLATLSAEAREALGVASAEVVEGSVSGQVLAYGRVTAPWQQHHFITTTVAGRISNLFAKPGEQVKRGRVLADVQSPALDTLQTEFLTALNNLTLSNATLVRTTGLAEAEVVAGRDLTEALSINRQNQYALDIARSKLKSIGFTDTQLASLQGDGQTVRSLPIISPIDGVIIHSDLMVGKVVKPTQHLFEVINLSEVDLLIDVLEADLHKVKEGQVVEFTSTAYPDVKLSGHVTIKEAFMDDKTHVGRIWVRLKNDATSAQLLPGMYGQAQIIVSGTDKKPLVAEESLLSNGTDWYVLVEAASTSRASEYVKRNVHVGRRGGGVAEIIAGEVYPGDQVVTTGAHVLSNFFVQGVLRLSPEAALNMGLRIEAAELHPVSEVVEVDGAVDLPPENRAAASSQLAGTIHRILVDRGQTVRAGDVVAEISSVEFQETQLQLLMAHFEATLLEDTLKRYRTLDKNQVIARSQLQETETSYNSAVFRRDSARRTLSTMGLSEPQLQSLLQDQQLIGLLPVRAPIDGAIVGFEKALGQAIDAEEPIFEIHNLSTVWVRAYLSERDLPRISIGTPARVRFLATPDFLGSGSVVRSSAIFGSSDRTLSVWVELTNPGTTEVYHNMLATISFEVREGTPSISLPLDAIVSQGTRSYIFVQEGDGAFVRRGITLGKQDDLRVEVKSGLKLGEKVAVKGAAKLQTAYASIR